MDPYIGEIRLFAGNFPPKDWAFCQGQLLPISRNTTLFSLLGTTYGGDGKTTFALPNLMGTAPMHWGNGPGLTGRPYGENGGSASETLLTDQMPAHIHVPNCDNSSSESSPVGHVWAGTKGRQGGPPAYAATPNAPMAANLIASNGGSQPHNNMQPFLALNYIIALQGVFPPRG